jgi:CRP/FNR family cyclic AMP-dependent transcriptional regulator
MISPEIIRRYPFFAGLDNDQIVSLAKLAKEKQIEAGSYIFREDDQLGEFFLLLEGAVEIVIEVPDRDAEQPVSEQLAGKIKTKDVTVSTVGNGEVFGWPGLIPPHEANASAKALTDCRVVAFDCEDLLESFEENPRFGYKLTLRAAQVMRERLRDMRIESLAFSN